MRDRVAEKEGVMVMVCGIETTDEDIVLSDEEVQEAIDVALRDLGLGLVRDQRDRMILETLVWKVVKRFAE